MRAEGGLQRTILDFLAVHRIWHMRMNTGAVTAIYKGKRRFIRFSKPGCPDIFALHRGLLYGIEVKSPEGKMSLAQIQFAEEFEKAGGIYILSKSLEDVMKHIDPYGRGRNANKTVHERDAHLR